ncbi:MAG TPA: transcription antitermination factor NusB [Gemmatimonadaceae bacterium]|nr:transcription antitermination factor NusB [Gemmatimonadaceae bacterium]
MKAANQTSRRRSREAALQMLYQLEIGRTTAQEAIVTYWPAHDAGDDVSEPLRQFANALVLGTMARLAEVDAIITAHAQNWRIERMVVIDRIVLRLAIYELLAEMDTPARVVINEGIELARTYSGEEAVPFVNGVLDSVRKELKRE